MSKNNNASFFISVMIMTKITSALSVAASSLVNYNKLVWWKSFVKKHKIRIYESEKANHNDWVRIRLNEFTSVVDGRCGKCADVK